MPPEVTQPLVDPQGVVRDVPASQVAASIAAKWRPPTSEDTARLSDEAAQEQDYGGTAGAAKAAAYGVLRGVTIGGSDVAFRLAGKSAEDLRGLQAQNPGVSAGTEFAGALLPSIILPESLAARTPAGAVGGIGKAIARGAEEAGYGLGKRALAATAGAAAEGSLYGGGQYLSQVALDDKPLAAEGFLASMGKGALWAAPIGGALTLGEGALVRARSLFPRGEVTKQAARGIDREATSAIAQSVQDGDAMVAAARRRIAVADTQLSQAAAGERVSRTMFGEAGPQAAADQVTAGLEKQKLTDAVDQYTKTTAALEDWVRLEADPDLEAALLRIRAPNIQVGAPQLRAVQFGEVVPPQAGAFAGDLQRTSVGKLAKGTPVEHGPELPPMPSPEPPAGMPEIPGAPAAAESTRADRRAAIAEGTPVGAAPPAGPVAYKPSELPEIQRWHKNGANVDGAPSGVEPPPVAPERIPGTTADRIEVKKIGNWRERKMEVTEYHNGIAGEPRVVSQDEAYEMSKRATPGGFTAHLLDARKDFTIAAGIPDSPSEIVDNAVYIVRPSELADRGTLLGNKIRPDDLKRGAEGLATAKLPTVEIDMAPNGEMFVLDGNHRIQNSAATDRPMAVRFRRVPHTRAEEAAAGRVALDTKDPDINLTQRIRDALPRPGPSAGPTGDDLESLLRRTQDKLATGTDLNEIGAPSRAEYLARKEMASAAASAHFRAKARGEGTTVFRSEDLGLRFDPDTKTYREPLSLGRSGQEGAPWNEGIGAHSTYAESPMAAQERAAQGEAIAHRAGLGGRGPRYSRAMKASGTPTEKPSLLSLFGLEGAEGGLPSAAESAGMKGLLEEHGIGRGAATTEVDTGMRARIAEHEAIGKTIVDHALAPQMGRVVEEDAIAKALRKHAGKNVDIGADLARAAKVIGDHEAAAADLVDLLGAEAPPNAVNNAKAYRAALAAQHDAAASSAAKAAGDIGSKVHPAAAGDATKVDSDIAKALRAHESASDSGAGRAVVSLQRKATREAAAAPAAGDATVAAPGSRLRGALKIAADVGTALEVLHAMGVHTPDIAAIPVIGPVLSLFLKARAVLGVIGRRGGSIGRSTESVVAARSAAVRDRVGSAAAAALDLGARGARRAGPVAGPIGALAYRLFPGTGDTKSKDPRALYQARADELARAQAPGAIESAIADRIRTSDPHLQDAIVEQAQRAIAFLDSKRPGQGLLQSAVPGDGKWHPSSTAIERFSKYVAAVHDPAGVLEDLANGHPSKEGAETLQAVYPGLFLLGQRELLRRASEIEHTLPYTRRVSISIMYRVPVDLSMSSQHMQFLKPPEPPPGAPPGGPGPAMPPPQPALTAPLQLGQQTLTSLERRAGA